MYDYLELKDYKTGLEAAATFFANPGNPDYVYLDYVYFARLLEADKQYEEAVVQFNKALSMDKSHTEIYKDISDVYEKKRDFPKAIEAYKNYLDVFINIIPLAMEPGPQSMGMESGVMECHWRMF